MDSHIWWSLTLRLMSSPERNLASRKVLQLSEDLLQERGKSAADLGGVLQKLSNLADLGFVSKSSSLKEIRVLVFVSANPRYISKFVFGCFLPAAKLWVMSNRFIVNRWPPFSKDRQANKTVTRSIFALVQTIHAACVHFIPSSNLQHEAGRARTFRTTTWLLGQTRSLGCKNSFYHSSEDADLYSFLRSLCPLGHGNKLEHGVVFSHS